MYVSMSSFTDSSDKLSSQEPGQGFGTHLTAIHILGITGGLSVERIVEIFDQISLSIRAKVLGMDWWIDLAFFRYSEFHLSVPRFATPCEVAISSGRNSAG